MTPTLELSSIEILAIAIGGTIVLALIAALIGLFAGKKSDPIRIKKDAQSASAPKVKSPKKAHARAIVSKYANGPLKACNPIIYNPPFNGRKVTETLNTFNLDNIFDPNSDTYHLENCSKGYCGYVATLITLFMTNTEHFEQHIALMLKETEQSGAITTPYMEEMQTQPDCPEQCLILLLRVVLKRMQGSGAPEDWVREEKLKWDQCQFLPRSQNGKLIEIPRYLWGSTGVGGTFEHISSALGVSILVTPFSTVKSEITPFDYQFPRLIINDYEYPEQHDQRTQKPDVTPQQPTVFITQACGHCTGIVTEAMIDRYQQSSTLTLGS